MSAKINPDDAVLIDGLTITLYNILKGADFVLMTFNKNTPDSDLGFVASNFSRDDVLVKIKVLTAGIEGHYFQNETKQ